MERDFASLLASTPSDLDDGGKLFQAFWASSIESQMARVNTVQLEGIIAQCFYLSMDGQISVEAQDRYMGKAMLLRRRFAVLKAKEFGDGDQGVKNANLLLLEVNNQLVDVKLGLGSIPVSDAALGKLIGALDMLVTLVELTLESRLPRIYGDARVDFRR